MWMPPSYSRKNFYAMIGNLRRSGLLRRVKVNENTAVQLTPKGLSELINRYGHAGLAWGEVGWAVEIGFREAGGKKSLKFGLGCLRRGAYISPFPFSDSLIQILGDGKMADKYRFFRKP